VAGALAGCRPTEEEQLRRRLQAAITFRPVRNPDLAGWTRHWDRDGRTAWYDMKNRRVLVLEPGGEGLLLEGFPADLGWPAATGWDPDEGFFVDLMRGSDAGTIVWIDPPRRRVTRVETWAAW
jgi:hypothetical protein